MTPDPATELKSILSHSMTNSDYDPKSTQRERFVIDHLVEEVRNWEQGTNTYAELRAIFAEQDVGNFSLDHWIASIADQDIYDLPDELT
jgi:hypothetical protein